jgi:hypothetical protein
VRQGLQERNVGGRGSGKGDVQHGQLATGALYHPPPTVWQSFCRFLSAAISEIAALPNKQEAVESAA